MRVFVVYSLLAALVMTESCSEAMSTRARMVETMRTKLQAASALRSSSNDADNGAAQTTTQCVKLNKVVTTLLDHDHDGMLSPGDCLQYPPDKPLNPSKEGQVSVAPLPDDSGRYGQFIVNATCGGVTLALVLDPSEIVSQMPSAESSSEQAVNMTCPEGQVAVRVTATPAGTPPASRITTTTGRGIGVPVSSCSAYGSNYEEDGGLCYPKCNAGYTGAGPLCLTNCPSGFRNDGLYCAKPSAYGRGGGNHFGLGSCPSGEERNGLLCYPKCKANFHAAGCCLCSPNCPSGMDDIGVSCQKGSYGRGAGKPLKCPSDSDYDAGLCYRHCPSGAHGVGPLCYAPCTDDQPYRLGIWCYHSESERNEILGAIIGGVIGGAVVIGAVAAIAAPTIAISVATVTVAGPLEASVSLGGSLFTPVASLSILSLA